MSWVRLSWQYNNVRAGMLGAVKLPDVVRYTLIRTSGLTYLT